MQESQNTVKHMRWGLKALVALMFVFLIFASWCGSSSGVGPTADGLPGASLGYVVLKWWAGWDLSLCCAVGRCSGRGWRSGTWSSWYEGIKRQKKLTRKSTNMSTC